MHPLKKYLNNIRIAVSTPEEYEYQLETLAHRVGVSAGRLVRLHYENQSPTPPETALRLELATNGQVPASSVTDVQPLIDLVHKVMEMRVNNAGEGSGKA
jgi:hypothetical protein